MSIPEEIEDRFWRVFKANTLMIGLDCMEGLELLPVTAHYLNDTQPVWFFTVKEHDLPGPPPPRHRAVAIFVARDHRLFARIHGTLIQDFNQDLADGLRGYFAAALGEDDEEEASLAVLRFEGEHAEIWLDGTGAVGVKMLLGGGFHRWSPVPEISLEAIH